MGVAVCSHPLLFAALADPSRATVAFTIVQCLSDNTKKGIFPAGLSWLSTFFVTLLLFLFSSSLLLQSIPVQAVYGGVDCCCSSTCSLSKGRCPRDAVALVRSEGYRPAHVTNANCGASHSFLGSQSPSMRSSLTMVLSRTYCTLPSD